MKAKPGFPGLSVEVIARGKVPDRPIEDKRATIAFGAAIFGVLGTLIAVILASIFSLRIRYSDDLDPRLSSKIAVVVPDGPISDADLQRASLKLRNEIDMRHDRVDAPVVVAMTDVSASGDASRMAVALSSTFAARKLKVLLIDANSTARITSQFEIEGDAGLADVMAGGMPITSVATRHATTLGDIDILSTGTSGDEVSRDRISKIAMQDFRDLINKAGSHYDVVILDLGELAAGRHSALGASVSDQLILVASAGDSKRVVRNAASLLDRVSPDRYALAFTRASFLDPMLERPRADLSPRVLLSEWLKPFRKTLELK